MRNLCVAAMSVGVAPIHGSLLQQQHAMQAAKAQQQQQQQQVPQSQQQQQPMVQRGMGMPPGPVAAVPAPGAAAQHAGAPGGSAPPPNEKYNPEQVRLCVYQSCPCRAIGVLRKVPLPVGCL